jgi:hypothetical protein
MTITHSKSMLSNGLKTDNWGKIAEISAAVLKIPVTVAEISGHSTVPGAPIIHRLPPSYSESEICAGTGLSSVTVESPRLLPSPKTDRFTADCAKPATHAVNSAADLSKAGLACGSRLAVRGWRLAVP